MFRWMKWLFWIVVAVAPGGLYLLLPFGLWKLWSMLRKKCNQKPEGHSNDR